MRRLELLAPARDLQIGIAAIDCGADAVYIAGPRFGARQAAGNDIDDIRQLCGYARQYGVHIFVTLNTILYDNEIEEAWTFMTQVQEAGADALIVQDLAIVALAKERGYTLPLHASTQCAIRTPEDARFLESLGFSRLILERELSLEQIRAIRKAVDCELEFFVHGALCVCYSGQCYLSEHIAGRSANRGACIQACRSRYDLVDEDGKVLVRDKALLSLKDYNLKNRLNELAEAGITSFKIEGRLKNESYVRNVVRDYSMALDALTSRKEYERESWGIVNRCFQPDTNKTFNRGYTELYLEGRRGGWASMDAAKGMGEEIGQIISLNNDRSAITLSLVKKGCHLNNGDGFCFVSRKGDIYGFRGDLCNGNIIKCKANEELFVGARVFRNIDIAFEKEIERNPGRREIPVSVNIDCRDYNSGRIVAQARSQDGRLIEMNFESPEQAALNKERIESLFQAQVGKSSGIYSFTLNLLQPAADGSLPFMGSAAINSIRRALAEALEQIPCNKNDILRSAENPGVSFTTDLFPKNVTYKQNVANSIAKKIYKNAGAENIAEAYELSHTPDAELMRTKYCLRYELGICPKHYPDHKGPRLNKKLFLVNNGQKFALNFDCANCEMTVTPNTPKSQK